MRKHFDDQIAQLGEQMMAMGALVENTIERAIRALQTDDMAEAAAIRDGDHIVDEKEREVEAMCIHMLLQQQPVARDLRTISAAALENMAASLHSYFLRFRSSPQ